MESQPAVEPPRGMYPAKLDDKGRLKLPADFQAYLGSISEKRLFVTSLDRRIAKIYPMDVWRENERVLEGYRENPAAARKLAFNAADLGGDAEMDGQGRILFPAELRRELGIENSTVRVYAYHAHLEVLSDAIYQQRRREAAEGAEGNVELLEQAGLK